MEIVERCIGLNGINFVRLRGWEAWVLRKLKNSTTLCFPNKCGVRSIIQTPSAIGCSKIDFFLKSSILEARDSICDSYAWKSILSARDVIWNGKVWCISNGYLVGIKQDKWLPNQSSITPISTLPDLPQDAKLNALINPKSGEWKKEVVQSSLLPYEAAAILGIPISSRAPP